MKNLLLKFKGLLGSVWSRVLNHYITVCAVLIVSICFLGNTLRIQVDYEKQLLDLEKNHIEAMGLIEEQAVVITEQNEGLEDQSGLIQEQGALINRLIGIVNEQKSIIHYQGQIIQELMKRLRDNGLLPKAPNKDRSDANWILYERPSDTQ